MLFFVLGTMFGLLNAIIVFIVLTFFRAGVEKRVQVIETYLEEKGPKEEGAVFLPTDEATLERQRIIDENNKRGIDTPLSDLM